MSITRFGTRRVSPLSLPRAAFCLGPQGATRVSLLARLDFAHLVATCLRVRDRHELQHLAPTIAGERTEFYLDGRGAQLRDLVMAEPNPRDLDARGRPRPYGVAWHEYVALVQERVRSRLLHASPFALPRDLVDRLEFDSTSLIVHFADRAYPAQWPHFDVLSGGQVVVALTDDTPSTSVYDGPYDTEADLAPDDAPTPDERRMRDREDALPAPLGTTWQKLRDAVATVVTRSRAFIEAHMRGSERLLRRGEFSVLTGPVMHAGPATPAGHGRIVMFFTFREPGGARYDMNEQYGPTNAALLFNSARLIVHKFQEYLDYDPAQFWAPADEEDETGVYAALKDSFAAGGVDVPRAVAEVRRLYTGWPSPIALVV